MEKEIKFGIGVRKIGIERSWITIFRDQRLGEILGLETTQRLKCLSGPEIPIVVSRKGMWHPQTHFRERGGSR
jgi:hypothetical protein